MGIDQRLIADNNLKHNFLIYNTSTKMLFIESDPMPHTLTLTQMKCGLKSSLGDYHFTEYGKSHNNGDRIKDGRQITRLAQAELYNYKRK